MGNKRRMRGLSKTIDSLSGHSIQQRDNFARHQSIQPTVQPQKRHRQPDQRLAQIDGFEDLQPAVQRLGEGIGSDSTACFNARAS
jgi:hypothetical protein